MNPQERDVINGIFDRLKQAEDQPRDAEAEALIADRLKSQPGAAYLLAQIVHVQEQALANLNERVNTLEAEAARAKSAPASGGGFLASLFGAPASPAQPQPSARPSTPSRPDQQQANAGGWNNQAAPQQSSGPWGNRAGAGGGFLASAMTTAAGVAGGMMLGNVLTNAFGLNSGSHASTASTSELPAQDVSTNTSDAGQADATYQEASYDPDIDGGFDDFGGGDDWI